MSIVPLGRSAKAGLAVVALVVASVGTAFTLGLVGAPSVAGVENRFSEVNETTTVVETDLNVHNPNPIGVSLGGVTVDYGVDLHGVELASGTKEGVSVGQGNSTVRFRTAMNNSQIPTWWVRHVRDDEHSTLSVNASVHSSLLGRSFGAPKVTRDVDTNIVGAFNSNETRPLNANAEPFVTDPVLYLEETRGEWGTVDENRTEVKMAFVLRNPKSYPVTVSEVSYDIDMNDLRVGRGATEKSVVIPPGETRTVHATTVIDTQKIDEWWASHLERNQRTELRASFAMRFDLSAAGAGTVEIPFEDMTRTIETDIFGTKNGTSESTGRNATATATATPDGTPTTNGENETPAETATSASKSPTPSETAVEGTDAPTSDGEKTDDGVL